MSNLDHSEEVQRQDCWSMRLPWVAGIIAVFYWYYFSEGECPLITFAIIFIMVAATIVFAVMFLLRITQFRWRGASSALISIFIIFGGMAARTFVVDPIQDIDFEIHKAEYEGTVKLWREKNPTITPLRLVVGGIDRSLFLTNIFDNIVYDESDEIMKNPDLFSGIWLCAIPAFTRGIMVIGDGKKFVRKLGDHFYFVQEVS